MSPETDTRTVQPYLSFEGRCEEALEFYRNALDAEVTALIRYSDSPDPSACAPGTGNKIMHASLRIGQTILLASDGRCAGQPKFQGISLALTTPTVEDTKRTFAALAKDGQVMLPLTQSFFSPSFGMVADRFGVLWMVQFAPAGAQLQPAA